MIIRVLKNGNYTTMSNYHFREKDMSLKAKGLLSLILSLPDNWNYSIGGLVAICKENETAIKSTLAELKEFGYLEVVKNVPTSDNGGRISYEYIVHEKPIQQGKIQGTEILPLEILPVENQGQLNTNILNTNKSNTNIKYIKENNILKENEILNQNAHATSVCCVNKKSFVKPKLDEVVSYCKERNNNVDAEAFIDFYESNGWKVGRNSMKDWKAAVRTWERNYKNKQNSSLNNKKEIQFETVTSGDDPYDISFEEAHEEYGFDKKTYEEIMKAHGKTPRYDT